MYKKVNLTVSLAGCLCLSIFTIAWQGSSQKAFADGLSQENLPGVPINDRLVNLFVKINPTIITDPSTDSQAEGQSRYIQLRLVDSYSNEAVGNVTYDITVTKAIALDSSSGSNSSEALLLHDTFHSSVGPLTLQVFPAGDNDLNSNTMEKSFTILNATHDSS